MAQRLANNFNNQYKCLWPSWKKKKNPNAFTKLTNVSSKFAKENCFNLLMKVILAFLESDFNTFANGIQKIQENMSEIFYGSKNNYSNHSISKIF